MFSKCSMGTKTNSGSRRQSILLISYSLVSRKYHRKQLRNEKFKVKLHFTMPPLRRYEMLIWSVYMCKLLWGGSIVKVKVTTALFPLFPMQSERFNILKNLVRLHFTIPPLRQKGCYELQANDGNRRLRQEILIWSVYMCKLLWGRILVKVKVTTWRFFRFEYDVGLLTK